MVGPGIRSVGRRRAPHPTRRRKRYIVDSDARYRPSSASRGTSCLGERWPYSALVKRANSSVSSRALSAFPGRCRGPHRPSSASGRRFQRWIVRAETPITGHRRGVEPRRSRPRSRQPRLRLVLLVGVVVLVRLQGLEFLLSTSNAAASASAFSFRASSRSSVRIRFIVASEARPSSPSASRHCSYSARSTASRWRKSVSSAPVSVLAFARIRIFSSIDQSPSGASPA
jgi:hypothetical protein